MGKEGADDARQPWHTGSVLESSNPRKECPLSPVVSEATFNLVFTSVNLHLSSLPFTSCSKSCLLEAFKDLIFLNVKLELRFNYLGIL